MRRTAYLGLGSNLGDRHHALCEAATRLDHAPGVRITARSSIYETAPVGGPPGQPDYLNAVLRIETDHTAEELLARCLQIERELGRRRFVRDGPRTMDIDVLLYGDAVLRTEELSLPHPRLHERRFVLEPLAEIDAALGHPVFDRTVGELLDRLPDGDRGTVRRLDVGWVV